MVRIPMDQQPSSRPPAGPGDAYVIIGGVKQAGDDKAGAKAAYKKYLELAPNGQYAPDLRAIVDSP